MSTMFQCDRAHVRNQKGSPPLSTSKTNSFLEGVYLEFQISLGSVIPILPEVRSLDED